MAEERYINDISQVFALSGHGVASMLAALSLLNDPSEAFADHVKNGGEIGTDIHIPRKMLPEFERRCAENHILFMEADKDAQSEFVTIYYLGAKGHERNELGDYVKEDGTRVEIMSDTSRIKAIANELNEEYIERNSKEYLSIDPNRRVSLKDPCVIAGMDKTTAILAKEQLADHWIESNLLYDDKTDSYAVEFEKEFTIRKTDTHLSPAESAIREAFFLSSDRDVTNYINYQERSVNPTIIRAVNDPNFAGYIFEPLNMNRRDNMGLMDVRVAEICIKEGIANVYIKDTLKGLEIEERLDLKDERDKLRLFKDMSYMEGKNIISTNSYKTFEGAEKAFKKMKENHELLLSNDVTPEMAKILRDPYEFAKRKKDYNAFSEMLIKSYSNDEVLKHCNKRIDRINNENANKEGWVPLKYKTIDEIDIHDRAYLHGDTMLAQSDVKRFLLNEKIVNIYYNTFTKDDIAFSKYMSARTLDPRIANSTEVSLLANDAKEIKRGKDREIAKEKEQRQSTMDISSEMRIDNSNIVFSHVAVVTQNNIGTIALNDRERVDSLISKMKEKFDHTKIVMGERKEIIGDLHSYDKPVNYSSLTAQEFNEFHEAYYNHEDNLDNYFFVINNYNNEIDPIADVVYDADDYAKGHDYEEMDPFGNDGYNYEDDRAAMVDDDKMVDDVFDWDEEEYDRNFTS